MIGDIATPSNHHLLSDDVVNISRIAPLPQQMRKNNDSRRAGLEILSCEAAAQARHLTPSVRNKSFDARPPNSVLCAFGSAEGRNMASGQADRFDSRNVLNECISIGGRHSGGLAFRAYFLESVQPGGLPIWKRPKQNRIHDTEHGRVGSNAERKNDQ